MRRGPLDFFFPHSHPLALCRVGPQEVFVRIVKGLGQSSHQHTLPFSSHGPTLVSPEPQRARVLQASSALAKPTTVPPCTPPPPPFSEHHSVKRGGEAEPSLHTAQLDSLPPQPGLVTGACPGRHADPRVQAHSTRTRRWAHMHTNARCPLAHSDVHHTLNTDTRASLCTHRST